MSTSSRTTTRLALLAAGLLSLGATSAALADTAWEKAHPRRDQVNDRLAVQNARIHQQRKAGDLTPAQAAQLHQADHQIRREERAMASQNGGHITKAEQKTLNAQENAISKQIGH